MLEEFRIPPWDLDRLTEYQLRVLVARIEHIDTARKEATKSAG